RFGRYKLCDEGDLESELDDAITAAHLQRAAIVKAVYSEEFDEFERTGLKALHDVSVQPPMLIELLDVGFILEDAEWIEQPDPANPGATRVHLKADPSFILDPEKHQYLPTEEPVAFKRRIYAGPKSVLVESENFRAPTEC